MKHLLTSTVLISFAGTLAGLATMAIYIYATGGVVYFAIDSELELAYDLVIIQVVIVLITVAWLRLKKHPLEGYGYYQYIPLADKLKEAKK